MIIYFNVTDTPFTTTELSRNITLISKDKVKTVKGRNGEDLIIRKRASFLLNSLEMDDHRNVNHSMNMDCPVPIILGIPDFKCKTSIYYTYKDFGTVLTKSKSEKYGKDYFFISLDCKKSILTDIVGDYEIAEGYVLGGEITALIGVERGNHFTFEIFNCENKEMRTYDFTVVDDGVTVLPQLTLEIKENCGNTLHQHFNLEKTRPLNMTQGVVVLNRDKELFDKVTKNNRTPFEVFSTTGNVRSMLSKILKKKYHAVTLFIDGEHSDDQVYKDISATLKREMRLFYSGTYKDGNINVEKLAMQ